jgi:hypothetical protein
MNALFSSGSIFNDCSQNIYFLYYYISFEIHYYFWLGRNRGFFWSKFQLLNRLMAIVFFSLLPLWAAASLSRISRVLFVKESRVICSFHLRDFKRISFPYECCFSCTYYEALYVYVMCHAFFYGFQTGMKYVLLFGPSLNVNKFQKIPSSIMWSSMTW